MSSQVAPQAEYVALPMRPHTILGVCEAIGEDLGFNPMWLRVPLAASVLFSPTMAFAAYAVLGVIVLASRLLFPRAKDAPASATVPESPAAPVEQSVIAEDMKLAA